jgi:hypothetical protein
VLTATRAGQAGEVGAPTGPFQTASIPGTAAGILNALPEYPCMNPFDRRGEQRRKPGEEEKKEHEDDIN